MTMGGDGRLTGRNDRRVTEAFQAVTVQTQTEFKRISNGDRRRNLARMNYTLFRNIQLRYVFMEPLYQLPLIQWCFFDPSLVGEQNPLGQAIE